MFVEFSTLLKWYNIKHYIVISLKIKFVFYNDSLKTLIKTIIDMYCFIFHDPTVIQKYYLY